MPVMKPNAAPQAQGATQEAGARPHVVGVSDLRPLRMGSPLARVLWEVWRGTPVTVVPSPPGAGKTTLLCDVAAHLFLRADIHIVVATPTNRGGAAIATRLARMLGLGRDGTPRVTVPGHAMAALLPDDVALPMHVGANAPERTVEVLTVASLQSRLVRDPRILVADEAWQSTFSDLARAADPFDQVVLVGDPGQIGPVVTVPTRAWQGSRWAPHVPAPEVFAARDDAVSVHLPDTYRLGAQGTDIVAPLYDFRFASARPERWLELGGERLDEVEHMDLGSVDDPFDPGMLAAVAARARALAQGVYVDGHGARHTLEGRDVAVVVSRNAQRSFIEASLAGTGITVGTADSLQGGQWPAVVALDPMIGYQSATGFALSAGRLCVMLSRQMAHVTWVHGDGWREAADGVDLDAEDLAKGLAVRDALMRTTQVIEA